MGELRFFRTYNLSLESNSGRFLPLTANNVTMDDLAPCAAMAAPLGSRLHLYLGWRRDEIAFTNQDLAPVVAAATGSGERREPFPEHAPGRHRPAYNLSRSR